MKEILIATHNKGKIKRYKELFSGIANLKLLTLEDLGIDLKVDEPYNTAEENSAYKAREYAKHSNLATIAIDEAVMTNFLPDNVQPGVFVRRLGGTKELSDLEVLNLWKDVFSQYQASNKKFIWDFSLSYCDPADNYLKTIKAKQLNTVADKFSKIINPGYPMSSFLIPEGFDKPHSELSEKESLTVDMKNLNVFFEFIKELVV